MKASILLFIFIFSGYLVGWSWAMFCAEKLPLGDEDGYVKFEKQLHCGFNQKPCDKILKDFERMDPKVESLDILFPEGCMDIPKLIRESFKRASLKTFEILGLNSMVLSKDTLDFPNRLEHLVLASVDNLTIKNNSLARLNLLRFLAIKWNGRLILEEETFNSLENLVVLYMNQNDLRSVYMNLFHTLTNLRVLYLVENGLTELPENLLSNLRSLEILDLSGNHIETKIFSNSK
jgi:Leucine-rich repeat (LRR) protein